MYNIKSGTLYYLAILIKVYSERFAWQRAKQGFSPITGLEWPRGFQEVKVPSLRDNGTGWW